MTPGLVKHLWNGFFVVGIGMACIASSGRAFAQERQSMRNCVPDAERLFDRYVVAANETPADVGQFFSQIFLAVAVNDMINAPDNRADSPVEPYKTILLLARGSRVEKKIATCSDTGCEVRTTMIDKQKVRHSFVFSYSSPFAECGSMLIDRWQIAVPL